MNEMADGIEVRDSSVEGKGVFADRPFHAGERVLTIHDSRTVDDQHPLGPGDDPRHCDYLAAVRVVLMQPPERHINHSCDPNVYVKTIDGRRVVIAIRDIAAGEEVAYDYCINSGGDTVWTCRCGSSRCRKTIHSDFFHLPVERQKEYLPLLDDWFRREHSAQIAELEN